MKKKKENLKKLTALFLVLSLIFGIVFYTKLRIDAEVNAIPVVFTTSEIPARTEITEDMITVKNVPSDAVPPNAVVDPEKVIGKWTVSGFGIPKNSMMYDEKILAKEQLPDSAILNLKENEVAFPLLVDLETSLGNSIIPNANVDLYFRSKKDNTKDEPVMYGRLGANVRVVAVKDAQASNVFQNEGKQEQEEAEGTETSSQPSLASIYIFAVPSELNDILNKAKLIGDVVPVATSEAYNPDEADELLSNEEILNFINGEKLEVTEEEGEETNE
jgi:pilus assembly protein CpaB